MSHSEIKLLFKYLDDNKEQLVSLQKEFLVKLKNQYKFTGLLTPTQIENLIIIKEKVHYAMENSSVPDEDFFSGLYSQLQEDNYFNYQ